MGRDKGKSYGGGNAVGLREGEGGIFPRKRDGLEQAGDARGEGALNFGKEG